MKKFFSLIALVGVFAACQPEKIETTFDPKPAVATITALAFDVQDGSDVTSAVTFSSDMGVVAGNVITITGTPNIPGSNVTVTGTFEGQQFSESVFVNELSAQGVAEYFVLLAVNKYPGKATIDYRYGIPTTTSEVFSLANASHDGHGHDWAHEYSHNGHEINSWMLNDTDMILNVQTTYKTYVGAVASAKYDDPCTFEEYEAIEKMNASINIGYDKTDKVLPFTVSAWAYYNVIQSIYTTKIKIDVIRETENLDDVRIAVIELVSKSSAIEVHEFSPNAHYIYGHGHGHLNHDEHGSTNAGGGIAYAD